MKFLEKSGDRIMEKCTQSCSLRYQVMETARQLFHAQGYDHTTLEDISKQLKINDHEVFNFFRSKDDLLEAVWSES